MTAAALLQDAHAALLGAAFVRPGGARVPFLVEAVEALEAALPLLARATAAEAFDFIAARDRLLELHRESCLAVGADAALHALATSLSPANANGGRR